MGNPLIRISVMSGLAATDSFLLLGKHCVASAGCVCMCVCVCVCVCVRARVPLGQTKVVIILRIHLFYFKGMLLVLYCILCIEVCIVHNCILLTL
jgi:hypothetical protein